MKALRDLTANDLDRLFREATVEAAREAQSWGLPLCGLNANGQFECEAQPGSSEREAEPAPKAQKRKRKNSAA